jgi:uncharacterized protein YlxW (UPF0749 family)
MQKRTWNKKQVSMLLAALILGILVSLQWSADAARSVTASDRAVQTILELEQEQEELKRTVGQLREELNAQQRQVAADTGMLQEVRAELALQKMRAGLLDVQGPGVRVVLDDGRRVSGAGSSDYLIHDFDLRDVINVLWLAGAEAVAVNGERIVNNTSIYCVGSTVMVNATRLSPPYYIEAIGDLDKMQEHLGNPGYLGELKARCKRFGLQMEVVQDEMLVIPAYRGSLPSRFAQPGG